MAAPRVHHLTSEPGNRIARNLLVVCIHEEQCRVYLQASSQQVKVSSGFVVIGIFRLVTQRFRAGNGKFGKVLVHRVFYSGKHLLHRLALRVVYLLLQQAAHIILCTLH